MDVPDIDGQHWQQQLQLRLQLLASTAGSVVAIVFLPLLSLSNASVIVRFRHSLANAYILGPFLVCVFRVHTLCGRYYYWSCLAVPMMMQLL